MLRPKTAAILNAGLPGDDPDLVANCSKTLQQAGYSVLNLDADNWDSRLSSGDIDLLLLPNAGVLPTTFLHTLDRFLKSGGNLIALGAPLSQISLIKSGDQWTTAERYQVGRAMVPLENPIFGFPTTERGSWKRNSDKPENPASYEFLPDGGPIEGQGSLHVKLSDVRGWDILCSPKKKGLFPTGHSLTLITVKGDGKTGSLHVEWQEQDGSRWVAVILLTDQWRQYALRPEDFKFLAGNPARGGTGDHFRPENPASFAIGLSNSETGPNPGSHEYWVGPVGSAAMNPEIQNTVNSPLVLDTLSPRYKFFSCTQTDKLAIHGDQAIVAKADLPYAESLSSTPRPGGGGFNKGRNWRWIPLIEATGRGEWRGNPATLLVHTGGAYKGGIWAAFGVKGSEWYQSSAVQKMIGEIARRMQNGVFLLDGGSNFFTYYDDQKITLGITAANVGRNAETVTGRIMVTDADTGKQAAVKEWKLELPPGKTIAVSQDWKPSTWPKAGFQIDTELVSNAMTIDHVSQEAFVWTPKAQKEFVSIKDGDFMLHGKRWRINGVNYLPSSGIATEDNEFMDNWLQVAAYDPEVVDRDLRHIKDMGLNAVSIYTYHSSIGAQNLIDLLRRIDNYGLKANLSLRPGTPMNFLWPKMKEIIEHYRLKDNDTVFAYELAWEPWLGTHADRKPLDAEWKRWILERYGSVENAEQDWGYPVPRDPSGQVTNPSWQNPGGDWTRMFAAYRRFCDTILYKRYDAARRLVKSIDPNHYIGFRMSEAGNPTLKSTDNLPYDFPGIAAGVDILEPEAYARTGIMWEDVKPGIFEYEYARWVAPDKPIFWAEVGCNAWDTGMSASIGGNNLAYVGKFYEQFYRMLTVSGADGVFFWWYAGGYRTAERSDFGIINPDGTDRAPTKSIREYGPIFLAGPSAKPVDDWIEIDRDKYPEGIGGVYDEVKDRFWASTAQGKTPGLRTSGTGTDSATCPLTAVGNTAYNGNNPPKYLDGAFDAIEILCADGKWEPLAKGGSTSVKAGGPVKVRVTLTNLGEAAWVSTSAKDAGGVQLTLNGAGVTQQPLEATVPYQGCITEEVEIPSSEVNGESKFTLGIEAKGRAHFGEKFSFTLIPQ